MTVALAVTIITLIKLLMYGLTFVSIIWLFITLLYILSTTFSNPWSNARKFLTVLYLFISVVAFYAAFVYDLPVLPKMESHIKADTDNYFNGDVDNNADVVIETPKPVAVETDNIVPEDATITEEMVSDDDSDNYDTNLISEGDYDEIIELNENVDNQSEESDLINEPQNPGSSNIENELDESFK
jgi:energy-coupling factor transporter transmembrane protein EcfT